MRKLVYAKGEQQRCRLACASAQSDQRLFFFRCLDSIILPTCYIRNFKTLAGLCDCSGLFVFYLVKNPEGRFSRDETHIVFVFQLKLD